MSKYDQINLTFVHHLNRLYWAKAHLFERLPEIAEQAWYPDLKNAVRETLDDIGRQIERIEKIYKLLGEEPSLKSSGTLVDFVEAGFTEITEYKNESGLRDLAILSYLSIVESVEVTSFQFLRAIAPKLEVENIIQLLKESIDEASGDRKLFLQVALKFRSDNSDNNAHLPTKSV